jgi:hypothetical protein
MRTNSSVAQRFRGTGYCLFFLHTNFLAAQKKAALPSPCCLHTKNRRKSVTVLYFVRFFPTILLGLIIPECFSVRLTANFPRPPCSCHVWFSSEWGWVTSLHVKQFALDSCAVKHLSAHVLLLVVRTISPCDFDSVHLASVVALCYEKHYRNVGMEKKGRAKSDERVAESKARQKEAQ